MHYLQSQNGNLFTNRYFDLSGEEDLSEFEPLRDHIPSEVLWCSDALGMEYSLSIAISPDVSLYRQSTRRCQPMDRRREERDQYTQRLVPSVETARFSRSHRR